MNQREKNWFRVHHPKLHKFVILRTKVYTLAIKQLNAIAKLVLLYHYKSNCHIYRLTGKSIIQRIRRQQWSCQWHKLLYSARAIKMATH